MASYRKVEMVSGKIGYTVHYFYNNSFWYYTVQTESVAVQDVALLNMYIN